MKNSKNKIYILLVGILQLSSVSANSAQPRTPLAYEAKVSNCTIVLRTNIIGRMIVDNPAADSALFSEISESRSWAVRLDFRCIQEDAKNYCPEKWSEGLRDEDPSTLKRIGVKRYDFRHPIYYSLAYAVGRNTMDPPRDRTLFFCLGDESRTVVGWVPIGNDKNQFSTQALKIINTLKIHPTVNAPSRP